MSDEEPVNTNAMPEGTYDYIGVIMSKSEEGDAVAEVMREVEGVEVIESPSFWDIRAKDRMVIPFADVEEVLGGEVDGSSIQREMSTAYGRQVITDDAMLIFSDPIEAMEYLSN